MSEVLTLVNVVTRLLEKDNILILCHKNPDGDTLGSAGALAMALKSLKKTVAILCEDRIPDRYDYMEIEIFDGGFEPEYIVSVDVAGLQLFGDSVVGYGEKCDLCIDHHPSNTGFAKATFVQGNAAATAEIIFDIITQMEVRLTGQMADCLYTGVATDTGCFKFVNTTAETHIIAAELIKAGADYIALNSMLFESKSQSRLKIEGIALQSLEYYYGGACAVIAVTREDIAKTGVDNTDLEGLTAIPRTIQGVSVGITMRQQSTGSYKVSVRTAKSVNACTIAAHLGGGGHKQAAGCEIIGSLEFAKTAILTEVARELGLEAETIPLKMENFEE